MNGKMLRCECGALTPRRLGLCVGCQEAVTTGEGRDEGVWA